MSYLAFEPYTKVARSKHETPRHAFRVETPKVVAKNTQCHWGWGVSITWKYVWWTPKAHVFGQFTVQGTLG